MLWVSRRLLFCISENVPFWAFFGSWRNWEGLVPLPSLLNPKDVLQHREAAGGLLGQVTPLLRRGNVQRHILRQTVKWELCSGGKHLWIKTYLFPTVRNYLFFPDGACSNPLCNPLSVPLCAEGRAEMKHGLLWAERQKIACVAESNRGISSGDPASKLRSRRWLSHTLAWEGAYHHREWLQRSCHSPWEMPGPSLQPEQHEGNTLVGHQGFSEPTAASKVRLKELYIPL